MNGTILQEGALAAYLAEFATSLAIGLLIGLERERSPAAKAGLRTFALVAMFGTLAAMLSAQDPPHSAWLLVSGLLLVGIMVIASYWRKQDKLEDPGTTTVAAILVCYGLGALVWHEESMLAVMLAIITTILRYFKTELHGITQNLGRRDLLSILRFAVLSFIILLILPNQNYWTNNNSCLYQRQKIRQNFQRQWDLVYFMRSCYFLVHGCRMLPVRADCIPWQ